MADLPWRSRTNPILLARSQIPAGNSRNSSAPPECKSMPIRPCTGADLHGAMWKPRMALSSLPSPIRFAPAPWASLGLAAAGTNATAAWHTQAEAWRATPTRPTAMWMGLPSGSELRRVSLKVHCDSKPGLPVPCLSLPQPRKMLPMVCLDLATERVGIHVWWESVVAPRSGG